jgi:hypothetical protein
MRKYALLSTIDANDPIGGLGARQPRPDEVAQTKAEEAKKLAKEARDWGFEKVVHATEKQMRQEAAGQGVGRASGSAPLGNSGNSSGAPQKLDERGYLVSAAAAKRVWPRDFKREINDPSCNLLAVFNDHFGLALRAELAKDLSYEEGVVVRDYLLAARHLETVENKVWFHLAGDRRGFFCKPTAQAPRNIGN